MQNERLVYKVVSVMDGNRVSTVVCGKALVEYIPGEWAYPPEWLRERGNTLTAFEDIHAAAGFFLMFIGGGHICEMWEAKSIITENSGNIVFYDPILLANGLCAISDPPVPGYCFPPGTIFCDKLKLIRKIGPLEIARAEIRKFKEEQNNG